MHPKCRTFTMVLVLAVIGPACGDTECFTGELCSEDSACGVGHQCDKARGECFVTLCTSGQTGTEQGPTACSTDSECAAEEVCNTAVGDGECQLPGTMANGEPCGAPANCTTNLVCDQTLQQCRPSGAVGDACEEHVDCLNGRLCNGVTQRCQEPASTPEGEVCFYDEECVPTLICATPYSVAEGCAHFKPKRCQPPTTGKCCGEFCKEGYVCHALGQPDAGYCLREEFVPDAR